MSTLHASPGRPVRVAELWRGCRAVAGVGLTCKAPPADYVSFTTAPDELGVPGRLYQYWVPPTVS